MRCAHDDVPTSQAPAEPDPLGRTLETGVLEGGVRQEQILVQHGSRRIGGQGRTRPHVRVEVPQEPERAAPEREPGERAPHRVHRRVGASIGQPYRHGRDEGEAADRSRSGGPVSEEIPPVPSHVEVNLGLSRPPAQPRGDRGDEQLGRRYPHRLTRGRQRLDPCPVEDDRDLGDRRALPARDLHHPGPGQRHRPPRSAPGPALQRRAYVGPASRLPKRQRPGPERRRCRGLPEGRPAVAQAAHHLLGDDAPGPTIDDEIVADQRQPRPPPVEEDRPQEAPGAGIEPPCFRGALLRDACRPVGPVSDSARNDAQRGRGRRGINGPAVVIEAEAQRVVPIPHGRKRLLEGADVDRLRQGQHDRPGSLQGVLVQAPAQDLLVGRERPRVDGLPGAGLGERPSPDPDQRGDRRRVEERLRRELDPRAGGARDDPNAQQRIAADLEEIVVYPDLVETEHLLPDVGELSFAGVARGVRLGGGPLDPIPLRRGQGPAIQLPRRGAG